MIDDLGGAGPHGAAADILAQQAWDMAHAVIITIVHGVHAPAPLEWRRGVHGWSTQPGDVAPVLMRMMANPVTALAGTVIVSTTATDAPVAAHSGTLGRRPAGGAVEPSD
jgi:hypothetical protein